MQTHKPQERALETQERAGRCFNCRFPLNYLIVKRMGEWQSCKFNCPNCGALIETGAWQGEEVPGLEDSL